MKKFISFLLVAMLVISSFAMTALAAESVKVTASAGSATVAYNKDSEQTVSINYTVSGNFANYQVKITNNDAVSIKEILNDGNVMGNPAKGLVSAAFGGNVSTHTFTVTYTIPANTAPGTYGLGISLVRAKDADNNMLDLGAGTGGAITVACDHKWSEWKETGSGTCVESRTCSVCGVSDTRNMEHNIIYFKDGEKGHWTQCSNCGREKTELVAHTYGAWVGNKDGHTHSCVCGYKQTAEHNPAGTLSYDKTYHWYPCTDCDYHCNEAGHVFVYNEKDGWAWQSCTCGYETPKIDIGPTGRDEAPDMYDNTPHLVLGFAAILFSVVAMVYGFKRKVSRK